jgi:hypothetical protein
MKTLVQRKLFRERTFQLTREHIRVIDRTPISGQTYDVPYHVLFGQRVELMTTNVQAAVVSVILMVATALLSLVAVLDPGEKDGPLAYLFVGAIGLGAIIAGIYWLLSRQELIHFYDSHSAIYIRRDRPSVAEVDAFLAEANALGRERMRSALLPLERTDDVRKNRAFAFLLRDKGILSDEECNEFLKPSHSPYRERLN